MRRGVGKTNFLEPVLMPNRGTFSSGKRLYVTVQASHVTVAPDLHLVIATSEIRFYAVCWFPTERPDWLAVEAELSP